MAGLNLPLQRWPHSLVAVLALALAPPLVAVGVKPRNMSKLGASASSTYAVGLRYVENLGLGISLWGAPASPWPELALGGAVAKSAGIVASLTTRFREALPASALAAGPRRSSRPSQPSSSDQSADKEAIAKP